MYRRLRPRPTNHSAAAAAGTTPANRPNHQPPSDRPPNAFTTEDIKGQVGRVGQVGW